MLRHRLSNVYVARGRLYGREGMKTYIQVLLVGDLYTSGWLITKRICHPTVSTTQCRAQSRYIKDQLFPEASRHRSPHKFRITLRDTQLTFLGLLNVTLVIPGTCFKPSLAIAFLAFFSLRECTATDEPAEIPASPSPPAASTSESELSEASSTSAPFLAGGSSGNSSMRGFDILASWSCRGEVSACRSVNAEMCNRDASALFSVDSRLGKIQGSGRSHLGQTWYAMGQYMICNGDIPGLSRCESAAE